MWQRRGGGIRRIKSSANSWRVIGVWLVAGSLVRCVVIWRSRSRRGIRNLPGRLATSTPREPSKHFPVCPVIHSHGTTDLRLARALALLPATVRQLRDRLADGSGPQISTALNEHRRALGALVRSLAVLGVINLPLPGAGRVAGLRGGRERGAGRLGSEDDLCREPGLVGARPLKQLLGAVRVAVRNTEAVRGLPPERGRGADDHHGEHQPPGDGGERPAGCEARPRANRERDTMGPPRT